MKRISRLVILSSTLLPMTFSGCLFTHRKLPIPKAPTITQNATAAQLVESLNKHWDALQSLNASIDINASQIKSQKGEATDLVTLRGNILMRKPDMLRVLGRLSVVGTRAFDLVSDGREFTLWIPKMNRAYKGSSRLRKKSASQLENIRPGFFMDALLVRGLEPEDLYTVTSDTLSVEDPTRKHLYAVPEYVLGILRKRPDSPELTPVRVVHFRRDDLLPYKQEIYDNDGNLETEVTYSNYADFSGSKYPTQVTIWRPIEEYQIVLTVNKITENSPLNDEQFQMKIPDNIEIKHLE